MKASMPRFSRKSNSRARQRQRVAARNRVGQGLQALEDRRLLAVLYVDDDGQQYDNADYTTIQAAIDAADEGDTIRVAAGTYEEELDIDVDDLRIIADENRSGGHDSDRWGGWRNVKRWGGGHHWGGSWGGSNWSEEVIIQAPASAEGESLIEITSEDVLLKGFTIRGLGDQEMSIAAAIEIFEGASATIEDNVITDIYPGDDLGGVQTGHAILVGATGDTDDTFARIVDNTLTEYQKGGIVVRGDGTDAYIEDNTITGIGRTDVTAQNGIQVSGGASATIVGNTVSGNEYDNNEFGNPDDDDFAATGILIFGAGDVHISDNEVFANDVGIYVVDTDEAEVRSNVVTDSSSGGILLFGADDSNVVGNYAWNNRIAGIGLYDANGNYVADNDVFRTDGDGILIDAVGGTAEDNVISDNDVKKSTGNGISVTEATATDIIFNNITKNDGSGILFDDADDNLVEANTISWNQEYGVALTNDSDGNAVINNTFRWNELAAIFEDATSENNDTNPNDTENDNGWANWNAPSWNNGSGWNNWSGWRRRW